MATEQIANARSAKIRECLKRAGPIEGEDYIMTVRFAEGDYARLLEIIRDLDRSEASCLRHRGQWSPANPQADAERTDGLHGHCN